MDQVSNDATLNTDAGGSSVPAEIGGLISTTEFTSKPKVADADPEGANNTEGTADGSTKGQEGAGKEAVKDEKDPDKLSGQEDRFDKHPRFQEMRTRAEQAEAKLTSLESDFRQFKESMTKKSEGGEPELPFKDVSKMTADELLDWQSEDPHGYHKNMLAQAKYEMQQDFKTQMDQKSEEDAIVDTFDRFAQEHPDFDAMWDRHELQDYISKHPGHNAISAYHVLTGEKRVNDAVDKAVKDAEKKFAANQKAKRENKSLAGGPQTTGTQDAPVDNELQDTKKFGGVNAVLAKRLAARRRQAGL